MIPFICRIYKSNIKVESSMGVGGSGQWGGGDKATEIQLKMRKFYRSVVVMAAQPCDCT